MKSQAIGPGSFFRKLRKSKRWLEKQASASNCGILITSTKKKTDWRGNFMKKKFVGALALASTFALAACSNGSSENVATTKYGNVTKDEFVTAMKDSVGEQTLQRLVLTKVLEGSIEDAKSLKTAADEEVAKLVAQYGGEPGLLAALQQSGITSVDAYRQTLYLNKLMTEAVKKAANFSEEDIKAYYDAWEPQITVQHILIAAKADASDEEKAAAKAKAEELIQQLKDGADFAELAKANSADTGTAAKGGQIGPFKRSDMVPEFSTAAYDLKNAGDITETPVQTQFGYHIIKLVSKEEKKPFDEMKEQMEKEMLDAKLKDSAYLHQTMVDLVKAADVKITDESLQNALKNFLQTADSETTTTSAK